MVEWWPTSFDQRTIAVASISRMFHWWSMGGTYQQIECISLFTSCKFKILINNLVTVWTQSEEGCTQNRYIKVMVNNPCRNIINTISSVYYIYCFTHRQPGHKWRHRSECSESKNKSVITQNNSRTRLSYQKACFTLWHSRSLPFLNMQTV